MKKRFTNFTMSFYLRLIMAVDSLALPPLDFGRALAGSIESLDMDLCMQTGATEPCFWKKQRKPGKQRLYLPNRSADSTAFRRKVTTGKKQILLQRSFLQCSKNPKTIWCAWTGMIM